MKKHKHWFQFVEDNEEKRLARFICLCGEQRIVEVKNPEEKPEK